MPLDFHPGNYYALGMGQRPAAWAHALFWLGAGLFALALWRQWSGVQRAYQPNVTLSVIGTNACGDTGQLPCTECVAVCCE